MTNFLALFETNRNTVHVPFISLLLLSLLPVEPALPLPERENVQAGRHSVPGKAGPVPGRDAF